jgi:hypothetical protein
MTENNKENDNNKILFINLITMLSMSTMQQLGKMQNPMTGKAEVQLEAAQATIDVIEMLQEKTKGNLDDEEQNFLNDTVSTLKMNYVETANNPQKKSQEEQNKQEPAGENNTETKKTENQSQQETSETEDNKRKFHKSYGE